MKKTFYILSFLLLSTALNAQPWVDIISAEKKDSKEGYTLHEVQQSFQEYWKPYDIKNGYYTQDGEQIKAGGWKQFKRWEWFWETRVDAKTGKFPEVNTIDLLNSFNQQKGAKSDLANWQNMGPNSSTGGYAGLGRINVIAFHPSDANTYWIGAPSGGLWKTTDDGESWTSLTEELPVIGVSGIIVADDYETSNTLFIATGDRDAGDNYSVGVLKSTDGGLNWQSTGLTFDVSSRYRITRFLADPADENIMLASTNGGIFRTTDGGVNWDMVQEGLFFDMEFMPGSSTVIYAATLNYQESPEIYKTEDGGATWTSTYSFPADAYRVELAVSQANANYLYAIACNTSSATEGVYQSTDNGENFTKTLDGSLAGNNLLGYESDGSDSGGQGWYDITLSASPSDENTLWVGGINTWKSTDGGVNWTLSSHWWGDGVQAVHADKHYMEYQNDTVFFEGNDGGIYKTTDGGSTWEDLTNGMIISQIYRIGPSQQNADVVMTGLQDNGSKLIFNGSWFDVKGGDGMECIIDYTDETVQYGTYVNGQIDRTTNTWYTSTDISANIPGGPNGAWVTPYVLDPNNNETIFVGYEELWKSEDRGDSWTEISNLELTDKIRSVAVAPSNSDVIYMSDLYYLYKTTDGGQTWDDINANIPAEAKQITYITVDHENPDKVWITFGGYDTVLRIMESTDGGTTWTDISAGLPSVPANCVVQNKLSSDGQLFVGTDFGAFIKQGSDDWVSFNQNLPSVIVNELEIYYDLENMSNSTMYAATYGRGLWKTPIPVSSDDDTTPVFELEDEDESLEIFPNPSNGLFTVQSAKISEGSMVKVYDINGKLIKEINNNQQGSIDIDLSGHTTGVYIIDIEANAEHMKAKVMLK